MNSPFEELNEPSLYRDEKTLRKLQLNHNRNKAQDHTALMEQAAGSFDYAACKHQWWNPVERSLLYGTVVWDQASESQRLLLNHLYWVAYYSQIISAEIATIFYNQTSAAGLYGLQDFRLVCDTLDLESAQERAHIHAFITVGESVESEVFNERLFTYPMRTPFTETMVFPDSNRIGAFWKQLQLRTYGLLSSGNAFIACQYFAVRGVRTLSGKLTQHALSRYYTELPDVDGAPLPAAISHFHFMDESFHFNSSTILAHDVLKILKTPTVFEKKVANMALEGCQRDHARFSVAVNGIFWHDPALYPVIYRLLRSPAFGLDRAGALELMRPCFTQESEGLQKAYETHATSLEHYRTFVEKLPYANATNREMRIMARASAIPHYLATNRAAMARFSPT
jgi:hypothetical protein